MKNIGLVLHIKRFIYYLQKITFPAKFTLVLVERFCLSPLTLLHDQKNMEIKYILHKEEF